MAPCVEPAECRTNARSALIPERLRVDIFTCAPKDFPLLPKHCPSIQTSTSHFLESYSRPKFTNVTLRLSAFETSSHRMLPAVSSSTSTCTERPPRNAPRPRCPAVSRRRSRSTLSHSSSHLAPIHLVRYASDCSLRALHRTSPPHQRDAKRRKATVHSHQQS
jgi:hypothetical protein